MFWAVHAGRVDLRGLELEQVVSDIQTLNEWATDGRLEVTAISACVQLPAEADRPAVVAAEAWEHRRGALRDGEIDLCPELRNRQVVA